MWQIVQVQVYTHLSAQEASVGEVGLVSVWPEELRDFIPVTGELNTPIDDKEEHNH